LTCDVKVAGAHGGACHHGGGEFASSRTGREDGLGVATDKSADRLWRPLSVVRQSIEAQNRPA